LLLHQISKVEFLHKLVRCKYGQLCRMLQLLSVRYKEIRLNKYELVSHLMYFVYVFRASFRQHTLK